jgi:hypothetical protein
MRSFSCEKYWGSFYWLAADLQGFLAKMGV